MLLTTMIAAQFAFASTGLAAPKNAAKKEKTRNPAQEQEVQRDLDLTKQKIFQALKQMGSDVQFLDAKGQAIAPEALFAAPSLEVFYAQTKDFTFGYKISQKGEGMNVAVAAFQGDIFNTKPVSTRLLEIDPTKSAVENQSNFQQTVKSLESSLQKHLGKADKKTKRKTANDDRIIVESNLLNMVITMGAIAAFAYGGGHLITHVLNKTNTLAGRALVIVASVGVVIFIASNAFEKFKFPAMP